MKCVKNNKTGVIERVGDKEAYNMVGNTWSYVAKSEWIKEEMENVVSSVSNTSRPAALYILIF